VGGLCFLCGPRGLADAILNLMMFLPLGLLAKLSFRSTGAALLLSILLAAGIEGIQVPLPGRDGSLSDVLFNVAGGGMGAIAPTLAAASRRTGRVGSARLSLLAALIAVAIHTLTAWSLSPQLPRSRYFSFWGPELEHLAPTDARLAQVTLAGIPVPEGWIGESETVRRLLIHGQPLSIVLDPGPAPASLGGLYAIYDNRQREVLLVGRIADELVVRVRRRAARLRLDAPDTRIPGVFAPGVVGDLFTIRLEREWARGGAYCATWSRAPGDDRAAGSPADAQQSRCDLGLTLGQGWALLAYPDTLRSRLRTLLDLAWIGLFFFPLGLWMRARWESVLGVALASVSLLAVPFVSSLLPTPAHLYFAAAAGLCVGLSPVRRFLRERWPAPFGQDRGE
jgi:hypothetical protein